MSKKLEALKEAVFYAEQKPEKLAGILANLVSDVATSVSVSGESTIAVPVGDTAVTKTYTAEVVSQYGDIMSGGSVTFSLKSAVTGVSINSSTGVLTVSKTAVKPSCTVVATSGEVTGEKAVTLLVPTNVELTGEDSINVPASGGADVTETYTAKAFNQLEEEIEGATVTIALKEAVTGVSISNGVVTVTDDAVAENFTLVGTCGDATVEKTVTLVAAS